MLKYNDAFWRYMTEIIRGELTYPELPRKLGPLHHIIDRWGDAENWLHRRELRRRARALTNGAHSASDETRSHSSNVSG